MNRILTSWWQVNVWAESYPSGLLGGCAAWGGKSDFLLARYPVMAATHLPKYRASRTVHFVDYVKQSLHCALGSWEDFKVGRLGNGVIKARANLAGRH